MSGSITVESIAQSLGGFAKGVAAFRYDGSTYTLLPAIQPLQVDEAEGADPGTARFNYIFDDSGNIPGAPTRWDQVYPLGVSSPGVDVVANDDRITVIEFNADGDAHLAFHGFAQIPQLDKTPKGESVTFQALGAAIRCWDRPMGGAYSRDMLDPTHVADVQCDAIPARFNPEGKPNCTPDGANAGQGPWTFPTFHDTLVVRTPDTRTFWTVAKAARYILERGNPQVDPVSGAPTPNLWIVNPDYATLDSVLDSRAPLPGAQAFDPSRPASYTSEPLLCQDLDVTGKPWPDALHLLLEPHGFGMAFRTEQTLSGLGGGDIGPPYQYLEVYRKNDAGDPTVKSLPHQPPGQALDPGASVFNAASLSRGTTDLANQIALITSPVRYEITVILAAGFTPNAADIAAKANFTEGAPGFDAVADKYRLFHFNECGDGYWSVPAASFLTAIPSLDSVLGAPDDAGRPVYIRRRRPPHSQLLTKPSGGYETYHAQLWVKPYELYGGTSPGVYNTGDDAGGKWQLVKEGWTLLKDRLGIRITVKNPEDDFNIGKSEDPDAPFGDGKINLITATAQPASDLNPQAPQSSKRLLFRLTCVIEGDAGLGTNSPRRLASPTSFAVQRNDEVRDRFRLDYIDVSSQFNTTGKDVAARDDRANAQSYSDQRRLAHELGAVAGSFTVPYLTLAYSVGDRIDRISGREPDVSLAQNLGKSRGEGAVYPSIVKASRSYEGGQSVTFLLSDRRGEPPKRRQS